MKRQRGTGTGGQTRVIQRSVKRPIDKQLRNVELTATNVQQVESVLDTRTFPGTIVGLRWNISAVELIGTNAARLWWAIVVSGEGVGPSTMSHSNAGTFYAPEGNVLAFGTTYLHPNDSGAGPAIVNWEGATKTMRKMQNGDRLHFIALSDQPDAVGVVGIVQFFIKS